jgi:hypothetical protein
VQKLVSRSEINDPTDSSDVLNVRI